MKYTKLGFTLGFALLLSNAHAEESEGKVLSKEVKSIIASDAKTNISYIDAYNTAHKEELVADLSFYKNHYKAAILKYSRSINLYKAAKQDSPYINERIKFCKMQIYLSNVALAKSAIFLGGSRMESKRFDEAIKHLNSAKRYNPENAAVVQEMIDNAVSKKKYVASKENHKSESVIPGLQEKKNRIGLFLAQGKALFAAERYLEAKKIFNEVLSIENTNTLATYYLNRTADEIKKQGYRRQAALHREAVAEVTFGNVPPIPNTAYSGIVNGLGDEIVTKTVETSLQTKLRTLKISGIDFSERSVEEIIDYIRETAVEVDPDREGVNIFTRFENFEPESTDALESENPDSGFPDDGSGGPPSDEMGPGGPGSGGPSGPGSGGPGGSSEFEDDGSFDMGDDYGDEALGDSGDIKVDKATSFDINAKFSINITEEITIGDAIEQICKVAGLKYKIEDYAVVIAAPDVPLDDMETKVFPLEREAISEANSSSSELRKIFQDRGVKFPAGSQILYDDRVSRLIVTNTPAALRNIETIVTEELNVMDPMVLITAKFIEITQNDADSLGFSWGISPPMSESGEPDYNGINLDPGATTAGGSNYVSGAYQFSDGTSLNGAIEAINLADSADVLSSPRVTTMNNREASIRMFEERYFPDEYDEPEIITQTIAGSGGNAGGINTIYVGPVPTFDDAEQLGITLNVTPTINSDRYSITLDIKPVIQEFGGFDTYVFDTEVDGEIIPAIFQKAIIARRELETKVTVNDGETIVIGGVIRDSVTTSNNKVPFFGDIPFFGRFFTSQGTLATKSNLLILLTCRLIEPDGSPVRERDVRGRIPFSY